MKIIHTMRAISEKRKGEFYIWGEVILWGFFPIIAKLSYTTIPVFASFFWSTFFAALFFAAILTYRRRWREARNPDLWRYTFFITLFIGVLFYGFYFLGLGETTPGNAAIIALLEVLTAFIFFGLVRRDTIVPSHVIGAVFMLAGAAIILAPNASGINRGDFLVLLAVFFSPIGNLYQQKARKIASSEMIMFLRSLCALPCIALLALIAHVNVIATDLRPALFFLLANGIFLLGLSKIFWIEAIHRMPVTKATALQSLDPLATLLFAWVLLSQAPTIWQLTSLVPFVLGTLLLTDQIKFRS